MQNKYILFRRLIVLSILISFILIGCSAPSSTGDIDMTNDYAIEQALDGKWVTDSSPSYEFVFNASTGQLTFQGKTGVYKVENRILSTNIVSSLSSASAFGTTFKINSITSHSACLIGLADEFKYNVYYLTKL